MLKTKIALSIAAVAILIALCFAVFTERKLTKSLPCPDCNIILISVDSLRADHISAYGYSRATTPHFDKLASDGLLFKNHHSNAVLTPITEGIVHSGLYPEKSGMISFRHTFGEHVQTLAKRFKEQGYQTYAFGTSPEFIHWPALKKSFSRGFENFKIGPRIQNNSRAWDWTAIRQSLQSKQKLFMWIAAGEIHAPFGFEIPNTFASPSYDGIFSDLIFFGSFHHYYDGKVFDPFAKLALQSSRTLLLDPITKKPVGHNPGKYKFPVGVQPNDMQYLLDLYDNGIHFFDQNLKQLTHEIESAGLSQRTVVVIHSEHGESIGEHRYIAHYDLWNEVIKTPLLITGSPVQHWREQNPQTDLTNKLSSAIDIAPTILSLSGLEIVNLDGINLFGPKSNEVVYLIRTPLWESVLETNSIDLFKKFNELDLTFQFKDYGVVNESAKLIHRKSRFIQEQFSVWKQLTQQNLDLAEYEFYNFNMDPKETSSQPLKGPQFDFLFSKLKAFEELMQKQKITTERIELPQEYK